MVVNGQRGENRMTCALKRFRKKLKTKIWREQRLSALKLKKRLSICFVSLRQTASLDAPNYDGETNTNYKYFRDYDPVIGSYVQSDPIFPKGGASKYSYIQGSPLSSMDPLGLFSSSIYNQITTDAILKAGSSCKSLPGDVALVDTLNGT